ncbi:MAG TPA: FHA domain-containing protein [Thermoanaerobaculia bacterium]
MIIECPNCRSKYQYDEERFERKPAKKIKCARCQQIFEIHNPAFAPKPVIAEAGDSTSASRPVRDVTRNTRMPEPEQTAQSPIPVEPVTELRLPQGRRLSLAILDGPDAGNVYRIEKPRVTIGRSGADLTLNDSEASRQHAAVEIRDTAYTLLDLGSTNGTTYEGQKITAPAELQDKTEFQVGVTTLMFIVTEEG